MTQRRKGPAMAATMNRPGSEVEKHGPGNRGRLGWQATTPLSRHEREWLKSRGVPSSAITEPWLIRSSKVQFDGLYGFAFDPEGGQALILRAEDRGGQTDYIAWEPRTGKLASWYGNAFCLGDVDDIFNPATYFDGDALRLHETPLDWLLSKRDGIVIVRPDLAPAYLADCERVLCANEAFARKVETWLQPRKPKLQILVEVEERGAA